MNERPWQQRWDAIVGKLLVVVDGAAEQQLIVTLAAPDQATVLGFVNAHALNLVAASEGYCASLSAADLLLRDGAGMGLLYRQLALEPGLNMNGTDLIPKLIAAYRGKRVALWGTEEPFVSQAAARCQAQFAIELVSVEHGFANAEHYLELARQYQPQLIVLGMGMPKQEAIAAQLAAAAGPCLIICGGAILDFLGGKVTRAPHWVRRLKGEWAYRLLREPRRLFKRYVIGNPLFMLRALRYRKAAASAVRTAPKRI